ncbi:hypothetical protein H9P43_007098 [Blastocladiella emersonii ATCC 22665]|nr:hypothetical protein H9P43_007098 [Blastocladiella emersonii ATCC 22665]
MGRRNDPTAKAASLRAGVARALGVDAAALFSETPTPCVCLLNAGSQGFLAISPAQFAEIVASLGPAVVSSWMPLARSFSFVLFDSPEDEAAALPAYHGAAVPQLPGGKPRTGLAAYVRAEHLPNAPASFSGGVAMSALDRVPGLQCVHEFVSADEEAALVAAIRGLPEEEWTHIHYGFEYVYDAFALTRGRAFPPFLAALHERLRPYLGGHLPTQATVSIYPPRAGIPPHVDIPEFGPYLVSLSLASGCAMDMRHAESGESAGSVYLPPRSLVVMQAA